MTVLTRLTVLDARVSMTCDNSGHPRPRDPSGPTCIRYADS
ncbi:hypothetical protein [Ornithinimicrobium murale]|nr:hypothetical protein [Ornithinimicrobium murale]